MGKWRELARKIRNFAAILATIIWLKMVASVAVGEYGQDVGSDERFFEARAMEFLPCHVRQGPSSPTQH
jgi:hypothetical protein